MVVIATQIVHENNFKAIEEVQISIGSDRIIRVNIDGVCALRVRAMKNAHIVVEDLKSLSNNGEGL